jgi:hypothetical protein
MMKLGPPYPVPMWRRIKFKSLTFPKVEAPFPEIDPEWFDTQYQQYRLPAEIVHGGSMTDHSIKAVLEANSVKKPEDDHEC